MDKIAFFHMNQLGDLLFSLPVIKAAREEVSGARLISIVKPGLSPLLLSSGLVDEVINKDQSMTALIKEVKAKQFDKAVMFSESPKSLISAYFSKIKIREGFKTASLSFLLTKKTQRTGVPSLANNKRLGENFGLKNVKTDYTEILKIPKENLDNANLWFSQNNLNPEKIVVISPGASAKRQDKCVLPKVWAGAVDELAKNGIVCVFSGAKWEENSLSAISELCESRPKVYAAPNILDSAAFLKTARMFSGIDSGAMHLAAALGTKCLGIFGHTDPNQVGPMPLSKNFVLKKESVAEITSNDIAKEILKIY